MEKEYNALGLTKKRLDEFEIRKYQPCDLSEVWQLFYQTVHSVCAKDYSAEQLHVWAAADTDMEKWAENAVGENTIIAKSNDKIVGFCDVNTHGYIHMFYVDKDNVRKGIGELMFKRLLSQTQAKELSTYASITAKPFFEKLGFVTVSENTVKRSGIELTNFYMTLVNEVHELDMSMVNNHIKNSKTMFVFACPGQAEEKASMVCYGQTGKNLEVLISKICAQASADNSIDYYFSSKNRYDYSILNSSTIVHYQTPDPNKNGKKSGRTTPAEAEIRDNIDTFISDFNVCKPELVILFGSSAVHAWQLAKKKDKSLGTCVTVIGENKDIPHLSYNRINRIKLTLDDIANMIKNQLPATK